MSLNSLNVPRGRIQTQSRMDLLISTINDHPVISLSRLQKICFGGIGESPSLRPLCWKLLLNYLPLKKREWPQFLDNHRKIYLDFVDTLIVDLSNVSARCSATDDPLSQRDDSKWNVYFEDNRTISQITSDCIRICPGMAFFLNETPYPLSKLLDTDNVDGILKKRINPTTLSEFQSYTTISSNKECHWEAISRILFIFAKLNQGVKYVQGMNEILAPIYFVFANDSDPISAKYAECDAFFCFSNLMGESVDNFIKVLDNNITVGSGKLMHNFMLKLNELRPDLYQKLAMKGIKAEFFVFRWLTLLYSQEFKLPDVIMLWDTLFSDPERFDYMYVFGVSMIALIEDVVLKEDFATILKTLLNYPTHRFGFENIHKVGLDFYAPAWELKKPHF